MVTVGSAAAKGNEAIKLQQSTKAMQRNNAYQELNRGAVEVIPLDDETVSEDEFPVQEDASHENIFQDTLSLESNSKAFLPFNLSVRLPQFDGVIPNA